MPEISLWLDDYDDIYSDFDSRHYLKRRISEDFLHELKMSKKYRKEILTELFLLLPEKERDENAEKIIADSLTDFFADQYRVCSDNSRRKLNNGLLVLFGGLVVLVINSYLAFRDLNHFPFEIIKIILEPAGWFLLWLSFDFLFYDLREIKKETRFFKELSEVNIHFRSS